MPLAAAPTSAKHGHGPLSTNTREPPVCVSCLLSPPPWQRCLAALPYAPPWSDLISAFKYQGEAGLVRFLALPMKAHEGIKQLMEETDLLLPVPLSAQRLQQRGFNQSLLLARALSPHKTLPDALLRLRDTPSQAALPREERLHNLAHALVCNPRFLPALQGRRVALVDDVLTTGSTLRACTDALLSVGVAHVDVIVLARATGLEPPQSALGH
jgi:ComF family protein